MHEHILWIKFISALRILDQHDFKSPTIKKIEFPRFVTNVCKEWLPFKRRQCKNEILCLQGCVSGGETIE